MVSFNIKVTESQLNFINEALQKQVNDPCIILDGNDQYLHDLAYEVEMFVNEGYLLRNEDFEYVQMET